MTESDYGTKILKMPTKTVFNFDGVVKWIEVSPGLAGGPYRSHWLLTGVLTHATPPIQGVYQVQDLKSADETDYETETVRGDQIDKEDREAVRIAPAAGTPRLDVLGLGSHHPRLRSVEDLRAALRIASHRAWSDVKSGLSNPDNRHNFAKVKVAFKSEPKRCSNGVWRRWRKRTCLPACNKSSSAGKRKKSSAGLR